MITTAGLDPWTWGLRRSNLDRVFGEGIIQELHVLELHGDKGVKLRDYTDSGFYWIEDKPANANLGFRYGLRPVLMSTEFNKNIQGVWPRVNTWKEIESLIHVHNTR